jgi:RNA polymerase primary sigma factor
MSIASLLPTAKKLLGRDEERALIARMKAGDRAARDELILRNTPLAIKLARRRASFFRQHEDDLVSAAMVGLIRAVDAHDGRTDIRVSTLAYRGILNHLENFIEREAGLIPVPNNVHRALSGVRKGVPARAGKVVNQARMEAARRALDLTPVGASGINSDGHGALTHLASPAEDDHDEEERAGLAARVRLAVASLGLRQRAIITLWFGLDGSDPLTLGQIGARWGISHQATHQAKGDALKRLELILSSHQEKEVA